MTTRTRLLTSAIAMLTALLPQSVMGAVVIYCGNLPGCVNASVQSYIGRVLAVLIAELPIFIYILGGLFIVIGGMYIVLSAGNSERVTKGKNTIIWAAIGIAAMEVIIQFNPLTNFLEPEILPLTTVTGPTLIPSAINVAIDAIKDLLNVALLGVAIFSGARMVLSGGKEDQYNKGREGLFWAAVGAIIINIAGALVTAFSNIYNP
jgi:hypothetical protein